MTFLYVLYSLLCLNLIVFVHELFHFLAAKMLKIEATEFGIGMGTALFRYQNNKGKNIFSFFPNKNDPRFDDQVMSYYLRLIPVGGYVSFSKMTESSEPKKPTKLQEKFPKLFKFNPEDKNYIIEDNLSLHKPWKRMIVAFAGPFGNFLFALVLAFMAFFPYITDNELEIHKIIPNSYAEKIGLQVNDVVTEVNGATVESIPDFRKQMESNKNLCITWERENQVMQRCIVLPHVDKDFLFGISSYSISLENAFNNSYLMVYEFTKSSIEGFIEMITGFHFKDLSGPIGTVDVMQQSVAQPHEFILIMIYINIGLAVINLLFPLSIMDGPRIFLDFLAILLRKHKLNTFIFDFISIILALCLMAFTAVNDVLRIFSR